MEGISGVEKDEVVQEKCCAVREWKRVERKKGKGVMEICKVKVCFS